jgi:hypothetical protein
MNKKEFFLALKQIAIIKTKGYLSKDFLGSEIELPKFEDSEIEEI